MVTLLRERPVSGAWPERRYGEPLESPLWVRFGAEWSPESWVGCFARPAAQGSWAMTDRVAVAGGTAVVSAAGYGYVVDATSGALLRPVDARARIQLLREAEGYPLVVAVVSEMFSRGRIDLIDASGVVRTIAPELRATGVRLDEQRGSRLFGSLVEVVDAECDLRFEIDLETGSFRMLEEVVHRVRFGFIHEYRVRPALPPGKVLPPPALAVAADYGRFDTSGDDAP